MIHNIQELIEREKKTQAVLFGETCEGAKPDPLLCNAVIYTLQERGLSIDSDNWTFCSTEPSDIYCKHSWEECTGPENRVVRYPKYDDLFKDVQLHDPSVLHIILSKVPHYLAHPGAVIYCNHHGMPSAPTFREYTEDEKRVKTWFDCIDVRTNGNTPIIATFPYYYDHQKGPRAAIEHNTSVLQKLPSEIKDRTWVLDNTDSRIDLDSIANLFDRVGCDCKFCKTEKETLVDLFTNKSYRTW